MGVISKRTVVVAGHICLDIIPIFPETSRGEISRLFVPGNLISVENAELHLGGAVANTGLAMALFGSDVRLMGKVGQDEFGENVIRILKAHGITGGMILSPTSHTSYSIVLAIPGHDRFFLHYPGANNTFEFADLDMEVIRQSALFHLGYPPVMRSLYSNDGQELARIFREVSNVGVATSLDLCAADSNSAAGQADWHAILGNTLPYVDIFAPSVEEVLFLLDRRKFEWLTREANGRDLPAVIDVQRDAKPLADLAIEMGAKIALIKCGEPGIYFKTAGSAKIAALEAKLGFSLAGWPDRAGFEASYLPERFVSATGAGDVAIAAFLTSLLAEYPLETCLSYATAAGACCVEAHDALGGLRSFGEMQAKMDAGWKKRAVK